MTMPPLEGCSRLLCSLCNPGVGKRMAPSGLIADEPQLPLLEKLGEQRNHGVHKASGGATEEVKDEGSISQECWAGRWSL